MNPQEVKNFEQLKQLVESREFEVENQWAIPLQGNQIDLIGNENFIRFKGDSVNIFLPYFGQGRFGTGAYGRDAGVSYEGQPKEFNVREIPEERKIIISFKGHTKSEELRFSITLFPGGTAQTMLRSSDRDPISYRGFVSALPHKQPE